MEHFIKKQLSEINSKESIEQQMYTLNAIYVALEGLGYKRKEIKDGIDKIIKNNIKELKVKLIKQSKEL